MNPSPLQLERHFFTKVQVDANPSGKAGVPCAVHCQTEVGVAEGQPKRYQVILRIRLQSPPGQEACYTGEIHAVGLFQVLNGWPADKALWLVESNGAALLYGAVREMLCNVTSRGPWPATVLSSVSFVQPKGKAPAGGQPSATAAVAGPAKGR